VQEHHIIPWNSKYTEDYIEYTKKFWIDTPEKLRKWWKNNRFLYPHTWRHPEEYHKFIKFKLEELSNKSKTLKEFEEWLDEIAKEIVEDPVWRWLVSESTIKKYLKDN
jgi:monoamine oxidase